MSKGENNMEYKKSSIFSDKQKIDNRNLCLYLNFKNEKNENILNPCLCAHSSILSAV